MKYLFLFIVTFASSLAMAQDARTVIPLNGQWQFDQTAKAFPPVRFTRTIPVPGLVHLAEPRIEQYDKFFQRPEKTHLQEQHNLLNLDYTPMYSWYKRNIRLNAALQGCQIWLTIKKSQYVTEVYVNGRNVGRSIDCYTPIDFNISDAVRFDADNEILIMVGDRAWLPSEAAGSIDKEKVHYLPGIWDDVFITATGKLKVDKTLFLPSLADKTVTVKTRVRSAYPAQLLVGSTIQDSCRLEITLREKKSGRQIAAKTIRGFARRDNQSYLETKISVSDVIPWTPDAPFLYEGSVKLYDKNVLSDEFAVSFGMRDFARKNDMFTLNGERFYLRGTNITLQRFFEDPDCGDLVWNRDWVKKLLADIPKSVKWNTMRICVGIVPDFWYDICDEYGIMLQNEWLYWQIHGWNEQVRHEYTEWLWSDGNHPSIVIWDAINENWDNYIGNELIPELKKLDPTRLWDAGYMKNAQDDIDEPHPYRALTLMQPDEVNEYFEKYPYSIGNLIDNDKHIINNTTGVPQLVNEYGWIWLWRNGQPSKLTVNNYNYFVGENATADERRELQAYWLQMETEWLRSDRTIAGVLAFCYLTNNYGFTGDWFLEPLKDLIPSPTLRWFKHCFAPQAVFINIVDERYTKHIPAHQPGESLTFNLIGLNDEKSEAAGKIILKLLDSNGKIVNKMKSSIQIEAFGKSIQSVTLKLPTKSDGYLLVAEFYPSSSKEPVISRRYLKVGAMATKFYDMKLPTM